MEEIAHTELPGIVFIAETGRGIYAFKSVFALIQWAETCSYKFMYAYYQHLVDGIYQTRPEITTMEYTIEDWLRQDKLVYLCFVRDGYTDDWRVELVEVLG
jgi:hypothetical protein